ncbi:MAG: DegV family EDD domain-containing protein [Clostridia bacterium]|nr:DegV family EDD domain-containing protein [Clostridia bacterium]
MKDYVILADVACDLSQEIRSDVGMNDYLQGHVNIDDGRDFKTTLDWSPISREDFYSTLSDKKRKVTSAPPNLDEYYAVFESYVKKGIAILSISLSSKISGTYNFSVTAANRIRENYPDAEIYNLDSLRMSAAFGLLVMHAHILKQEGKTYEEVIEWAESNKCRIHQMGPIDDLIFVARRGRITMGKAIMGSIVGVKPMGDCNTDGYVTVLTKAKGISKAMDLTVKYIRETASDIGSQRIIIAHSDREVYAEKLREMISAELSPAKIYVTDVFAGSGTNVGPGMVGVYYLGNEISEGLEAEKEVIARITAK